MRRLAALALAAALLAACSNSEPTTVEVIEALAATLQEEGFSDEEAVCYARGIVEALGVDEATNVAIEGADWRPGRGDVEAVERRVEDC